MSSTAQKPTIVIIPGAWHLPSPGFDPLIALLHKSGYPTLPIALPSTGSPATYADDVAAIRTAITSLIEEQGKDIVVLMHSYSGIPGTEAVRGFAKTVREREGENSGVVGLAYMAAMIAKIGETGQDVIKLNREPNIESGLEPPSPTKFVINGDGTFSVTSAADLFYNDLDDELAKEMEKGLKTHSLAASESTTTYEAYQEIPSAYLLCLKDRAIGYKSQERMVKATGIKVVERVEAGHSPFLSMPETVAAFVRRVAGEKF